MGDKNVRYNSGMKTIITIGSVSTPDGRFIAARSDQGIGRLTYPSEPPDACADWVARWSPQAHLVYDDAAFADLAAQLTAYLTGALRVFDLPLDLRGTPFQCMVWRALLTIPYGEVRSYGVLAAMLGNPRAARAVGAANGANPLPILVPCHRLIGANGALVRYGGGLALKRRLLDLEQGVGV